jgi:hypothetical protein
MKNKKIIRLGPKFLAHGERQSISRVKYHTPSYWLHGGFEVAISRIVHPKLYISTARL